MNRDSDLPLHLFQVLEEEYQSLHGSLPDGPATVHVPDRRALDRQDCPPDGAADQDCVWREVRAAREWGFLPGHVKDPVLLAALLVPRDEPEFDRIPPDLAQLLPSFDLARENLKRYVYGQIDHALILELIALPAEDGRRAVPPELERRLESSLNGLLDDRRLYHPDRFAQAWLGPAGRALIALRERHGEFRRGDDLPHFNRLLLEDAFPELEKIQTVRLAAICRRLHEARPVALSLSGGGIRSGTFALGLLQGLARHDLLKEFDYLSTVSGGGYIGSWLTAWLHRHPEGLAGVTRDLANCPPAGKIDPEPPPLLYLRQFSNFITPKVGLLTADTWAFVGIYLRNLLLNWMVVVPLLLAALLAPRLLVAATLAQPESPAAWFQIPYTGYNFHGRHAFLTLGFLLGVWAFAYVDFNRPGLRQLLWEKSRYWRARSDQGGFIRWCLGPLLAAAVLLTVHFAWSSEIRERVRSVRAFLVFAVVFGLCGWLVSSIVLRRWSRPAAATAQKQQTNRAFHFLALLGAVLFGGLLFWALSRGDFGNPVVGYKPLPPNDAPPDYLTWQGLSSWKSEIYVCAAVPFFLLVFWGATTLFVGVSSYFAAITDEDREWWARFGAWLLIAAVVWAGFTSLVIFGPLALLESPRLLGAAGGVSGLLALLLGRSSRTPARRDEQAKGGAASKLVGSLLPVLALVFLASLLAALSLGTTYLIRGLAEKARAEQLRPAVLERLTNTPEGRLDDYFGDPGYLSPPPAPAAAPTSGHQRGQQPEPEKDGHPALTRAKLIHMNVLHHTSVWFVLGLLVVLGGAGLLLSRAINLNIFSLHGGYRNRLIRAFLGASRPPGERNPNPFTGFDAADNIPMHELRPNFLDEDDLIDPARLKAWLFATPQTAGALGRPPHPATLKVSASIAARLEQVGAAGEGASQELLTALRTDLNKLLADARLFEEFDAEFMRAGRARRIRERVFPAGAPGARDAGRLRSDYRILLNRLVLEQAYAGLVKEAKYPPPPYKLLHVVNTSLNLVGGDNLAWQQRKAEPFSISPLHCGCFRLGYRESRDYGGHDTGGISIGTAAAISGAAASSNMGYYTTSPVISLLLTLFNVRLGWWLGNPGPAGRATYRDRAPRNSVTPVISEAFGMTDDRNEYVYLTDGGHFENLALYEMVLRRCRVIVCSDGAQDEEYRFGDLGNAVRKIRIDLGIPIEFTRVPIYAGPPDPEKEGGGFYWAVGKIRYSCVDRGAPDGVLVYVKPAVYGDEPRDILEYKKSFPAFPHQSTGDQFFDEPQFESYRALGSHVMDELCGEGTAAMDVRDLVNNAYERLIEKGDDRPAADPGLEGWLKGWLYNYDRPPGRP
jgi:hypothetical protein